MADVNSTWEKIQQGVAETEKLIGQKQYTPAMLKARQTLEYMVRCLGERACIVDGDMADIIDQLYEGRWITKTTREHYHRIRVLGNKAVSENDANPSDANDAYHILSQEVYSFANDYTPKRRRPTATNRAAGGSGQSASSSSGRPARARSQSAGSAPRRKKRRNNSPVEDVLRILIPIVCIILLIFIIRAFMGGGKSSTKPAETTVPETVTMAETDAPAESDTAAETPAETPAETTAAATTYKTTSTVNVRTEPSTSARILVQLEPGAEVAVTATYDDKWTIINYNGQDAYVATAYITQ